MIKDSPFTIVYTVGGDDSQIASDSISALPGDDTVPDIDIPDITKTVLEKIGGGSALKGGGRWIGTRKKTTKKKRTKSRGSGEVPKPPRTDRYLQAVSAAAPDLVNGLYSLNPELRRTLLSSPFASGAKPAVSEVVGRLRPIVEDLQQGVETVTVAFLDLDARVGRLPYVIEALNSAQPVFTFFDLQAPTPAGLHIPSDRFDSWVRHRAGRRRVSTEERQEFTDNLMFNDFYKYARVVRTTSGVDYIAGITQYMVAGEEEGLYYWNHFSTGYRRVILASAYDLRKYAKAAGRPFEVAVAGVALAQLLAEMNKKIDFHPDRGCIFDFNLSRVSIVNSLKKVEIEPDCLAKIQPKYRSSVEAMLVALRDYERPAEALPPPAKKKRQLKKHSNSYWLDQLTLLSEKLKKA